MRRSLIFATNNQHKVTEIRQVLPATFTIITLAEAGIDIDIPEPHDTLEANATEKSTVIYNITGKDCFSEDSGLEIEALNGEPGVKSARYAGDGRNFDANIDKVLSKLAGNTNRRAQFRTVISLLINGKEHLFEGVCTGTIKHERSGTGGFGYDPVFVPDGSSLTFAEMDAAEKARISHRAKATSQLIAFLQQLG